MIYKYFGVLLLVTSKLGKLFVVSEDMLLSIDDSFKIVSTIFEALCKILL